MTLKLVESAFRNSLSNSDEIEDAVGDLYNNPTADADAFFSSIVDSYRSGDDPLWIKRAIMYSNKSANKTLWQNKLEHILTQPSHYWNLGALLSTTATQLGRIAQYPNKVLGQTIELSFKTTDEVDEMILRALQATAYGAYISTATDFSTGRDAGNEVESRGIQPTVKMAEEFISQHR